MSAPSRSARRAGLASGSGAPASRDPATGQWLSSDPAQADGEESAYQYCGGDPIRSVDPSGESCNWHKAVHYARDRKEIGESQITVNQVAPGWTISARYREEGTESQPGYEADVPLKRRPQDYDIANAVAFLASDLAGDITGAFLPVCGGAVMVGI